MARDYAGLSRVVDLRVVTQVAAQQGSLIIAVVLPAFVVKIRIKTCYCVSLIRSAAMVSLNQEKRATAVRVVIRIVRSLHRLPLVAIHRTPLALPRIPVMEPGRVYPTMLPRELFVVQVQHVMAMAPALTAASPIRNALPDFSVAEALHVTPKNPREVPVTVMASV